MRFYKLFAGVVVSCALLSNATASSRRKGNEARRRELLATGNVIKLDNSHFTHGTYRILTPGNYRLEEDIIFNPNANISLDPYENYFPTEDQLGDGLGKYPTDPFRLGFFAAITVETSNVDIDLNGYSIEQGAEHALMQRFFAVIELANAPFLSGQGPHTFTSNLVGATNVYIHDGLIGRSAHHGIHGNKNANIRIENIDFYGYEVAAAHLNGVEGLVINNCEMENRKDLPVLGTFSAARFLQRYVDYLVDTGSSTTLNVLGVSHDALSIQDDLRSAIDNVFNDVVSFGEIDPVAHPAEYGIFANELGIIDGNAYCVVTNKLGIAVNGFPYQPTRTDLRPSRNVTLTDLHCRNHEIRTREIVALVQDGKTVIDQAGSVVQLLNKDHKGKYLTINSTGDIEDAWYIGNSVANAQMFVAKAIHNGEFDGSAHDVSRMTITPRVIEWVEAGALGDLGDLASESWVCNGDSMFHVSKGLVSYMISATIDAHMERVHVDRAINHGAAGSDMCGEYTFSHPSATLPNYNGAAARAFSFAGSKNVDVEFCSVTDLASYSGDAIGFDIFTDSENIDLDKVMIYQMLSEHQNAYGVRFGAETSRCSVNDEYITDVEAPLGTASQIVDNQ